MSTHQYSWVYPTASKGRYLRSYNESRGIKALHTTYIPSDRDDVIVFVDLQCLAQYAVVLPHPAVPDDAEV